MRRDDVRDALDAMAASVPEPSADAVGAIARGVRRIRQRRLTLAGVVALLAAIVVAAAAIASNNNNDGTPRVASVPTSLPSIDESPPTTQPQPTRRQPVPIPLEFVSPTEGWLCSGPTMEYTTDAGVNWKNVAVPSHDPSPPRYQYPVCAAVPDGEAWLLTSSDSERYDQVIHVTDGGRNVETFPFAQLPYEYSVRSLVFADSQRGWAILDSPNGEILATTDGGRTWNFALGDRTTPWEFSTPTDGWGSPYPPGAELAHTTDGGRTWLYVSVPAPTPATGLGVAVSVVAARGGAVVALGSNPTGNYTGLFFDVSTDGGQTWAMRPPPHEPVNNTEPRAVGAVDSTHWQLALDNRLYTTADAGGTWTQVADFAGISQITDLHFLTPDVGFIAATGVGIGANGTVVLQTKDGGDTWTTVAIHAPPMGNDGPINFPGGIIGCPTHPLANPPAGDPPAGLIEAAKRWSENQGEPVATIGATYPVGATTKGEFSDLFAFQIPSCGPAAVASSWVVEMYGPAGKGGGGSTDQTQAVLSYSPDGWHVYGRYH